MVEHDHSVLELMAAKSSSCNFLEQLSVCAEVIASQFWQNHRQIRDCLNVNALEWERFMLTADDGSYLCSNMTCKWDSYMNKTNN